MTTQDNDSEMLRAMGNAITDLQVRYRMATLDDQAMLIGPLKEMLRDYGAYQARLIKAGTITSDAELEEIKAIGDSISDAATRQELLLAFARITALIASA